jgi:disulfide bond formation protein DsbB
MNQHQVHVPIEYMMGNRNMVQFLPIATWLPQVALAESSCSESQYLLGQHKNIAICDLR